MSILDFLYTVAFSILLWLNTFSLLYLVFLIIDAALRFDRRLFVTDCVYVIADILDPLHKLKRPKIIYDIYRLRLKGMYAPKENTLVVSNSFFLKDFIITIAHEMRHWYQFQSKKIILEEFKRNYNEITYTYRWNKRPIKTTVSKNYQDYRALPWEKDAFGWAERFIKNIYKDKTFFTKKTLLIELMNFRKNILLGFSLSRQKRRDRKAAKWNSSNIQA